MRALGYCVPSMVALTSFAPCLAAQFPETLVGVWKGVDVPAEFTNRITGAGIALSGWVGTLKLRADGTYEFEEYRQGAIGNCRVSILQRSRGKARADGKVLTLTPASGTETKRDDCSRAGSYSDRRFTPKTERFDVSLSWIETLAGWTTLKLATIAKDRDGESYAFTAMHDTKPEWPPVRMDRATPARIPRDLPALWRTSVDDNSAFFDASTLKLTPPKDEAKQLRLSPDGGYEWVAWKPSVVPGPGCTLGVLTYEKGRFAVALGPYRHALWTTPERAVVIQKRSECGADNGERLLEVPKVPAQYSWTIGRTVNGEEVLEIRCSDERVERSEWQFGFCHWAMEFRSLFSRVR